MNVSSLLKHIDQLRLFCETHKPHLLCLNETKLDNEIRDEDLVIEGFHSIYRKDRDRHGGGVAMFISEEIKFLEREDLETDFESLTVELNIQYVKPILITTIYRPPDSLVDLFDKVDDLLRKIEFENRESIIAGDMNCYLLKEENHTKHIKNAYSTFGYTQLVKHATRTTSESSTLIDHLATTKPMSVSDKGVIPCGISDHDAIFLVRSMRVPRTKKQPKIIKVRKFQKFDNESFLKDLASLNLNEIKNITADPNHMWLLWKKMLLDLLDKHAPITEIKLKGNNLPYITMEMRRLIRTRDHLKKKANQSGSKYLHQAFQQIRNKVTYGIRKLRSDYYSKKIKESIGDIRSTWKILKEITNNDNKSTSINEINIDGKVVSDGKGISDALNDHFVSIGNKLAGEILDPVKTSIDYLSKTGKIDTRFSFKRI